MQLTRKDLNPACFARRVARKVQQMRKRSLFREHCEKIKRFKGRHAGERCFIIGNGPSLNRMDLKPLKDETTFGVNAIYLNYEKMGFRPTYYAVVDPNVAHDRADEINRLTGSTRFFPQTLSHWLKPGPGVLYVNYSERHWAGPDHRIVARFSRDAGRVVYSGSTVTYLNLQLAYHMGCDPVYLIGMDHSYTVPPHARGRTIVSRGDDPNHFHPDYFGKGYRWSYPRLWRMEKALRLAREEFEADGRAIINATVGGKLEVFPREDYETVIRQDGAGNDG